MRATDEGAFSDDTGLAQRRGERHGSVGKEPLPENGGPRPTYHPIRGAVESGGAVEGSWATAGRDEVSSRC